MRNKVQIWNPIAESWSIIDTETGCIIDRSKEPVKGIEKHGYKPKR